MHLSDFWALVPSLWNKRSFSKIEKKGDDTLKRNVLINMFRNELSNFSQNISRICLRVVLYKLMPFYNWNTSECMVIINQAADNMVLQWAVRQWTQIRYVMGSIYLKLEWGSYMKFYRQMYYKIDFTDWYYDQGKYRVAGYSGRVGW